MISELTNIFNIQGFNLPEELIEILAQNENIKIERIISEGHTSPKNFWYNQETNEFVILLKGEAEILFENDERVKLSRVII